MLALPGEKTTDQLGGAEVLGHVGDYQRISAKHDHPALLLACSSNAMKRDLEQTLAPYRPVYASAIHPSAVIAGSASLGTGVIINALAVIQPFAKVGNHVMIHAGVIIEHDVEVGDFANLAPRACLTGHVKVGTGATVFTGAVIAPTVRVGARSVVGAGAVLLSSIGDDVTAVGVPAKVVKARGSMKKA
jgi:acetyltransferase EpsM